ncbi:hypothetical protein DLAC_08449 [Tieghemostelium lacteum]|uniref:Uncharacterized protein n=1 Tax=Tieghemostelium lacteum TaxID=361077 RepID=A0A151ZC04_TIELA|nr:hypothetical protein DLAC_08449 [Tieghemostelium lacteum]|eukprot:KYQ91482.1 hypothetical protein DLAC_08449 [Tieghemostelium lacteum]
MSKEISDLKNENKSIMYENKCRQDLMSKEISDLKNENKCRQDLMSKEISDLLSSDISLDICEIKFSKEKLILGELARQFEKATCRALLGPNTRVYSLSQIEQHLTQESSTKWAMIKANINWVDSAQWTVGELKEIRLNESYPLVTPDGLPVTRQYINTIAPKHINQRHKAAILKDINMLINLLEQYNDPSQLYVD